ASAVAAQPLQEARLGAFGPALPVALAHALLDVLGHLLILVARLHDHAIFPSPCLAGDLARFDRVDGDALHDGAGPLALLAHVLAPERVVFDGAALNAIARALLLVFLFDALGNSDGARFRR